jgi:UDP:flavonoid glycosyltransferase YjiC (YdhE family)
MKRVLIITLPEVGHYHPFLGPARALAQRGARVAFAVMRDVRGPLERASGLPVLMPPGAPPPDARLRGQALTNIIANSRELAAWIRRLLLDAPREHMAPLMALAREFNPDLIVTDPMCYEAPLVAHALQVPWIGWSTSLNPVIGSEFRSNLIETVRALDPERHALFAEHGLSASFRVSDVLSPWGTSVFTTAALAGEPPKGVVLVGPSAGGTREGKIVARQDGRPLVYVSFGSQAWYQPARFRSLFAAARKLDVQVVAAVGDLVDELGAEWHFEGSNVRCARFVNQPAILSEAQLFITHAGANSVMESLRAGCPMLMAPICNDQPHNAQIVARAEAGQVLNLEHQDDDSVAGHLQQALDDRRMRASVREISRSYGAHSGAEGAADLAWRQL